jgi:short-subunit dehydrogenase
MRESTGRNAKARSDLLDLAEGVEMAGQIDVLINNAGFAYWGLTEAFSVKQAQEIFETNFFGAVRMNRAVLPHMRRRGKGLVIHMSSGAGRGVLPGMALYTATKFALEALAEAYRYELSQFGVD